MPYMNDSALLITSVVGFAAANLGARFLDAYLW